jgi:nucleoside-diphosphate-sugar epimerase
MKRILIVGSNGLVGSNVNKSLKSKYFIDTLDRHNIESVEEMICHKYDYLIFLALAEDYKSKIFTKNILEVNIELFRRVLGLSIGNIRNVIYFSTGSVYKESRESLDTDSALNYESQNPYVLSKIMAELMFQSFFEYFESNIIVRPFYIYGPNQNKNMLFNTILHKVMNNKSVEIGKNGGLIFNPIHVYDVVHFLERIISIPSVGNKIYNFCGKEKITLKELINKIGEMTQNEPLIVENNSIANYAVAESNNNFIQKMSIELGLKTIIDENRHIR